MRLLPVLLVFFNAKIVQFRASLRMLVVEISVIVQFLIVETELYVIKHFVCLQSSKTTSP